MKTTLLLLLTLNTIFTGAVAAKLYIPEFNAFGPLVGSMSIQDERDFKGSRGEKLRYIPFNHIAGGRISSVDEVKSGHFSGDCVVDGDVEVWLRGGRLDSVGYVEHVVR